MKALIQTFQDSMDEYLAKADDAYLVLNELSADGPSAAAVGNTKGWAVYIGQIDFNRRHGRVIPGTVDQHLYIDDFRQATALALSSIPQRLHLIAASWADRSMLNLIEGSDAIMQFVDNGGKVWINSKDVTRSLCPL